MVYRRPGDRKHSFVDIHESQIASTGLRKPKGG
jgi:hypothetical protein